GAESVQSPLHLIYGDIAAGGLISDEMAAVFRSQNPGFSTKQIPGASHSIHRDATEPFLKEVLAYLNQIGIDT
ncbi:MAG TPA: alpha/beta hydrolase, partial [Thermomicrobiales bacterium]|nr:alpha/beta hydrolase [Thermomicrobiales bacterium]